MGNKAENVKAIVWNIAAPLINIPVMYVLNFSTFAYFAKDVGDNSQPASYIVRYNKTKIIQR